MEEEQTRVLIVEDDAFQRLAVVDIFETLEYEVTAKENGQTAWESLNESTRGYNFAVIDMVMPEVDGLELLHRMKQSANPKIKNLPVFIMSSNEEVDMVTACIQMGAIDFMLKPINFALARSLAHKARSFQVSEQDVSEDISIVEFKGLNNYRRVRGLGRGAAGSVDLVEHIVSHQQFALKRIEFQFLTESEQLAAENEVILLRVLIGPTIIRYYDSFTEEGSLYIVMEFAEKNSVDEMVKDYKARGRKFDNEQIYDWIAQTVVALLIMHSKNILHRDLKIQNMFLSHDDVIKLGDFGIAKALSTASDMARTSCGTPYFMAPEVCRGEVYGQKADTWALGCAVYELLTLKKPFDGSNIQQIFDQIQRHNYESLPADVDPHLKLLVSRLLNKLPQHRPSVWELAVDTKIRQHIDKFVIDKNCWEEVSAVLDTADKTNSGNADKKTHDLSVSIPELYKIIRPQIQLEDLSGGWFGKAEMQVFRGDQLLQCIMDLNYNSEQAYNFATELLEQEVMYNIKQGGFKPDAYFRFREDRSDIARNTIHSWTKEVRVVSQVIQDLVIHANGILTAFQGNLGEVKRSVEFDNFLFAIAELQR